MFSSILIGRKKSSLSLLLASDLHIPVTGADNFICWLMKFIMHESEEIVEFVLSLCYGIWLARNKLCFEGKEVPPMVLVQKAWTCVLVYKAFCNALPTQLMGNTGVEKIPPKHTVLRWNPSPLNTYKINVDVASLIDAVCQSGVLAH